ncbi:ComEA family DNA-binding protein [Motiliproteus sp. MSK22-1]|uniref:ComEA family DNA-binding protein n=1 Tax=Motiliproteus sp. MSK22-1 TaxID=1897630 RepID=UPI0009786348|nr:ComEA family DNA-binding protein [Motiliproteus sp. MSK22-1]OMH30918.1 hypothetical protein BGP75_00865 [Motiliproteus sp. MSK22-1]
MLSKKQLAAVFVAFLSLSSSIFAADQVDLNQADASELALVLTGVGESKAQAIVEYRKKHGPFQSLEQLAEVKGVGESLIARNRDKIRISSEKQ